MEVVDETSPIEIDGYFTTTTVFEPPAPTRFRYWPGQVYETAAGDEVQLLPGTTEDKAIYELDGNLLTADPQDRKKHTSELQSLMRISYAVFCLNKKKKH